MRAYAKTHVGLVREQNEDTVRIDGRHGIFILADGMGGHQAGEVASALAADTLLERLKDAEPAQGTLHAAIAAANAAVYEQQLNNADQAGMGTTLTVLWDAGDHVLLGHVGDSRAYVYMQGRLRQVSKDHSMVGEMLRAGMLTEEQARSHPYRNVITRAVGTDRTVSPDIASILKTPGEKWLLCSDGLSDMVSDEEIRQVLAECPVCEAADRLIELALANGGYDNVSVLLLEVEA